MFLIVFITKLGGFPKRIKRFTSREDALAWLEREGYFTTSVAPETYLRCFYEGVYAQIFEPEPPD